MTYLTKSLLHGAGIVAVMLIFAGCDAYNPSFSPLDSNHDGIRYGFEEKGEGYFAWNITFDSSVGAIDPDASSLQLRPEGGADVLKLEDPWFDAGGAQGKSGPLQAGVYFLRLMLKKDNAYILVVQPIAIHRGQIAKFEQTYTDKDFEPFTLLKVNVQAARNDLVPVKLEEATLEFFNKDPKEVLSEPLCQTNGEPDFRRINMKGYGEYSSEGWTALPQGSKNFWMRLTIRDAKGRHFIRTKKHTIVASAGQMPTDIDVNWGTVNEPPITLLNALDAETVDNGKFTFASVGTDGKVYRGEEYGGAEPGCEVRIVATPNDSSNYVLQWIQAVSTPWLEKGEKLVHDGKSGYFTFTMPETIKPFTDTADIYTGPPNNGNQIEHDDSFFDHKNAVIVTGFFMTISGVALLNKPSDTQNFFPNKPVLINSFVHFEERSSLEQAIEDASINEQNTIVIRKNLEATNNLNSSFVYTTGKKSILIDASKNIALIPQPQSNGANGTITITLKDTALERLFEVKGTLTIGINKDTGATFTMDGNDKDRNLIRVDDGGTLVIQDGTFTKSKSPDAAIYVSNGTFTMTGGTIEKNTHALYIDTDTPKVVLSGSAFIPHTGTPESPDNNIVMYNNQQQITINGELTRLSKKEPACITLDGYSIDKDWEDNRPILLVDTKSNYEKFKVTSGKENTVVKPYTITSEGILYGPQATFTDPQGIKSYYLRLDEAFKAAYQFQSPTDISLLKSIDLGKAGNEAFTVTDNSYITVPKGKTINLIATTATGTFTISRAGSTAKTLFTVNGELNLKVNLDGKERPNNPPMVIVESGASLKMNNSEITNHRGGTGIGDAALNVKNGATVSLNDAAIQNNQRPTTGGSGGAIYNSGGTVQIYNGTVTGNVASNGGVIYNSGGTVQISYTTLGVNQATGNGGAIYNNGGEVYISDTKLSDNATGNGTGIYQNGTFIISNDFSLVNSDIFLPKGKIIEIGASLSGTDDVAIRPEYPITAARKVLLANDISNYKGRFTVNDSSGQPVSKDDWKINDEGYLFLGFDASCDIPENPGTFTCYTSGKQYKHGDTATIRFGAAAAIANTAATRKVLMGNDTISSDSAPLTVGLQFPINNTVTVGKHNISVHLTIKGQRYSGTFEIEVIQ